MSGSTIIMAPAMESSHLSRSHSTPELISVHSPYQYSGEQDSTHNHDLAHNDPRPDTDTDLDFDLPSFGDHFELDTSLTLTPPSPQQKDEPFEPEPVPVTIDAPPEPASDADASDADVSDANASLSALATRPPIRRSRTGSLMDRPKSWLVSSMSSSKLPPAPSPLADEHRSRMPNGQEGYGAAEGKPSSRKRQGSRPPSSASSRTLSVSESFSGFTKRSWLSPSRSSSPKRKASPSKGEHRERAEDAAPGTAGTGTASAAPQPGRPPTKSESSKTFGRAGSYFSRMKPKKQPVSMNKVGGAAIPVPFTDSDNASFASSASLAPPISNTTDTQNSQYTSHDGSTAASDDSSSDMSRLSQNSDPLWSSFKTLEVEHKNFASKSVPQRIVQIQNIVLPFLRNTMDHSSTQRLLPTDLDRRATVLGSWWTSLLEMVDGVGLSSVPGVDRPLMLETLTTLMLRSEWRQTTTNFLPLNQRPHRERVRLRKRPTGSSDDSFLDDSAEHNVRTMFITNIAKQLAFAVDKMTMRYCAPALVTFAGKTCAYAYFFLPGAADMLVRLWGLSPGLIRRAADELGLPRKDGGESDELASLFPPSLAHLGWTSPMTTWEMLKRIPQLPIIISRVAWTGPWMSRWKGRDTDLLFVFYKQFHILTDDFIPAGLPLKEKARSPGFALVHAQLLSVLDDTIHRQAAMCGPAVMDAALPGADASAMAMPMPPTNLMKGMAENSLVLLLRDMLTDENLDRDGAQHTFAEACFAMVKAAVRKTSQYDNPACFTLCDFLEEALAIYSNFEDHVGSRKYIDWPFWVDVFRRIFSSLNTMSEVRMLSFIYTIWDMAARDRERKANICLDWLLTEEVFSTFFTHWCPMVRAYYHRLLCWRICRFEGGADEVDAKIFRVVADRLRTTWANYLYLKQTAEAAGRSPPSTAPMVPTPGKKFMIIRHEVNQPQPGLFVNFDSLSRSSGGNVLSADDIAGLSTPKSESKKKTSLLGKVLSFTSGGQSSAKAQNQSRSQKGTWDDDFATARRVTAEQRSRGGSSLASKLSGTSPTPSESDSTCSEPVYDEQKYIFKFFLAWHQPPVSPRERMLTRPRLPAPTQAVVSLEAGEVEAESEADDENSSKSDASDEDQDQQQQQQQQMTEPIKPLGISARNAAYCGRSLSEWAQVVWECNSFVDRRCDEGVPSLGEVEVPVLGVESLRKLGS